MRLLGTAELDKVIIEYRHLGTIFSSKMFFNREQSAIADVSIHKTLCYAIM